MSASIPPMRSYPDQVLWHYRDNYFLVWYFDKKLVNYDIQSRNKPPPLDPTKEIPENLTHLIK